MRILITPWALDSYLSLRDAGVISREVMMQTLRPDILLLRERISHPRFQESHFWGPAQDRKGEVIPKGFKMKWRNVGNGLVQLRLCVALVRDDAWLCHGYVKTSPQGDLAEAAKLNWRIFQIEAGNIHPKGELR